jgi:hypothetical protein
MRAAILIVALQVAGAPPAPAHHRHACDAQARPASLFATAKLFRAVQADVWIQPGTEAIGHDLGRETGSRSIHEANASSGRPLRRQN